MRFAQSSEPSFVHSRSLQITFAAILALAICLLAIPFVTPAVAEVAHAGVSQIYLLPSQSVQSAATIFSGTVMRVEHLRAEGSPGITQITFHVENGIRRARRGENLVVREWAGLWSSGERYHTGEHVFLLLYPKSRLGLTSPVAGAQGRYEIDRSGRVLATGVGPRPQPIHISEFSAAIRRQAKEGE